MKTLLTGGSGLLGSELKNLFICDSPTRTELDITGAIETENNYDRIIHCAAYTDVAGAEHNKRECERVNIEGTMHMLKFAELNRSYFVYISSDYVYSGVSGNYKENDEPIPINFYAYTKWIGEIATQTYPYRWLIIRTSFKPTVWPYDEVFDDIYTSADYVDVIANKIKLVINSGESGIYNVGTEKKTLFDLARKRNLAVRPISSKNWPQVNMPKDCSMNCDKFVSLEEKCLK